MADLSRSSSEKSIGSHGSRTSQHNFRRDSKTGEYGGDDTRIVTLKPGERGPDGIVHQDITAPTKVKYIVTMKNGTQIFTRDTTADDDLCNEECSLVEDVSQINDTPPKFGDTRTLPDGTVERFEQRTVEINGETVNDNGWFVVE